MREKHVLNQHHRGKVTAMAAMKATAYFVILSLTFFIGQYFSSSSSSSSQLNPIPSTLSPQIDQFRLTTTPCSNPVPHDQVRSTILHKLFNGSSPFLNFPPPHAAHLLHHTHIKGWGSNGAVFSNLIKKLKPLTIIEIGSFLGASATHMANLTRQLGLSTQILCLDDFRGWPGFLRRFSRLSIQNGDVSLLYQFMQNVVASNASDSVLPVPFSTGSGLDALCEWGVYGDLIEVDAGHDFHSAWSDINRAYRILRPGGVLFGHDYFTAADNRGVRRAVHLFAKLNRLKVKVDGQHWVLPSP